VKLPVLKRPATPVTHPYGFQNGITTWNEIIVIRVRGQRLERSVGKSVRELKATWDSLTWHKGDRTGTEYATIDLLAGEYLRIEEGWEIDGPVRVVVMYRKGSEHTSLRYKPLPREKFDLDNPYEYPCQNCGATRGNPCVGEDEACSFRVFFMRGGFL